jgi:hypothetical protein
MAIQNIPVKGQEAKAQHNVETKTTYASSEWTP